MKKFFLLMLCVISLISLVAQASGGYREGSSSYKQKKKVDERYEYGKSIYTGRLNDSKKYRYCVKQDGEFEKITSRNLKSYRNTSFQQLADNLYHCDSEDTLMSSLVKHEKYIFVLYYLSERFRLDIKS